MKRWLPMLAALLLSMQLTGCGSDSASGEERTTLTVFAAASLTPTFTTLGKEFEKSHDGVQVKFNFAGSSDLVAQIEQGAPADDFASADTTNMNKAASLVQDPHLFASNTLMIAVPPDNPGQVAGLSDLTSPRLKVVVCAPQVPCGAAAAKVEKSAGVDLRPVSEEQSVTDVLNKVATGEADAGLVYLTDVRGAGHKVKGIAFPESAAAVNNYPIAVTSTSRHHKLAEQFVHLVSGPAGQRVLADAGFARPKP